MLNSFNTAEDFANYVRNGEKINAIKTLRAIMNLGLKEAKDMVEALPQFRAVGVPLHYEPVNHDNDHHIVAVDDGHYTEVIHFRDSHSRADALTCAKGKLDCYDNSQFDITVAKVIATTKRTLVTL